MKKVFVINSHTTCLTALGVIYSLKFHVDDILMLFVRNYSNSLINQYRYINCTELCIKSENEFNNRRFNKRNKRKVIEEVDDFVETNICERYHLFAPHLSHPFWIALYTNEKCNGFSYMQEGSIPFKNAYVIKTPIRWKIENFLSSILITRRVWYCRPWFLKDEILDISKVDSFATNNKIFKYLPVPTHIISWPLPDKAINIKFKKDHSIFIFDAHVKNGIMEYGDYITMCEKLVSENYSTHNYIKFHPGQSDDEINCIISFFKNNNLNIEILDNSIPFEYIIMTTKNLNLVGYGSSLLYMAHEYGHHVTCKEDELMKFKLFRKFRKESGCITFEEYKRNG